MYIGKSLIAEILELSFFLFSQFELPFWLLNKFMV